MKVLKFGAVWCSGCLVMRPRWQAIEKEFPWLKTEYHDYDQDKKIIRKYQIVSRRLPVCVFLDKKNQEFLRKSGEISKEELIKIIIENRDK